MSGFCRAVQFLAGWISLEVSAVRNKELMPHGGANTQASEVIPVGDKFAPLVSIVDSSIENAEVKSEGGDRDAAPGGDHNEAMDAGVHGGPKEDALAALQEIIFAGTKQDAAGDLSSAPAPAAKLAALSPADHESGGDTENKAGGHSSPDLAAVLGKAMQVGHNSGTGGNMQTEAGSSAEQKGKSEVEKGEEHKAEGDVQSAANDHSSAAAPSAALDKGGDLQSKAGGDLAASLGAVGAATGDQKLETHAHGEAAKNTGLQGEESHAHIDAVPKAATAAKSAGLQGDHTHGEIASHVAGTLLGGGSLAASMVRATAARSLEGSLLTALNAGHQMLGGRVRATHILVGLFLLMLIVGGVVGAGVVLMTQRRVRERGEFPPVSRSHTHLVFEPHFSVEGDAAPKVRVD